MSEIRKKFLDYFSRNEHQKIDSSNIVPNNDPTLMFTNSGMVQFKNVFTGLEKKILKQQLLPKNVSEQGVSITI